MVAPQPPAADDLVERLRSDGCGWSYGDTLTQRGADELNGLVEEAAARIAALEARVKVLEEAVRLCAQIVKRERDVLYDSNTSGDPPTLDPDSADYIAEYDRALAAARAALGEG